MTEIIKDAQKSENSAIENLVAEYQAVARNTRRSILEMEEILNAQISKNSVIENLVAEYQEVARKTCRLMLEDAKCVRHARTSLSRSDFRDYLKRIRVNSIVAMKLCVVADYESHIEDTLSRNSNLSFSFDEMYKFSDSLKSHKVRIEQVTLHYLKKENLLLGKARKAVIAA